ncbi:MAG: ACT domain-containing protein, partial [Thermoanaerobaculia bacterium]|nr:ACT domain-containing protein [Thermoanaerobaculia bacterium]
RRVALDLLDGVWAVARLAPDTPIPDWLPRDGALVSVTRTAEELSLVCPEEAVPRGVRTERGFRCLVVRGPLAFSEIGILAALARPLAEAGVSLFALSTFDTDFLLVPARGLDRAVEALRRAGHVVAG